VFVAFLFERGEKNMMELNKDIKDAVNAIGQQTASSAERVAAVLMQIAEAFGASVEQLQDALAALTMNTGGLTSMSADELATALNTMNPHRQVIKPIHRLNCNRPRITHQVSIRKPRHLVKKIIR